MYNVKQFGETSCSVPPSPDLSLCASAAPDVLTDLVKALNNDTRTAVRGEKGDFLFSLAFL